MTEEPMKVVVRVRPLGQAETNRIITSVDAGCGGITIYNPQNGRDSQEYTFDHVFNMRATQRDVYQNVGIPALQKVLDGYNATILAYGETGTGKTWTMEGNREIPEYCGIIPNIFDSLFKTTSKDNGAQYLFKISFFEIYNERLRDLLAKDNKLNLCIKDHPNGGVFVDGVSEYYVNSLEEIYYILDIGKRNRVTAATSMNEQSSRSHAIFQVSVIKQETNSTGRKLSVSKLNLVDLAGSECQRKTENRGTRLKESGNINKSLTTLRMIISELGKDKKSKYIRFRDSKLTRLLQDSLGGNSLTTLIATISPHADSYRENVSTLTFATQSQIVKCVLTDNDGFGHTDTNINEYIEMLNDTAKQNIKEEMPSEQTTMTDEEHILHLEIRAAESRQEVLVALIQKKEKDKQIANVVKERIQDYKRRRLEDELNVLRALDAAIDEVQPLDNRRAKLKYLENICTQSNLKESYILDMTKNVIPVIFMESKCEVEKRNKDVTGRSMHEMSPSQPQEIRAKNPQLSPNKQPENVKETLNANKRFLALKKLSCTTTPTETTSKTSPKLRNETGVKTSRTGRNIQKRDPPESEEIKPKNPQLSTTDRNENDKVNLDEGNSANERFLGLEGPDCTPNSSTEIKPNTASPKSHTETEVTLPCNDQAGIIHESFSKHEHWFSETSKSIDDLINVSCNGTNCKCHPIKSPTEKLPSVTEEIKSFTTENNIVPCNDQPAEPHVEDNPAPTFAKYENWYKKMAQNIDDLLKISCNGVNCLTAHKHAGLAPF